MPPLSSCSSVAPTQTVSESTNSADDKTSVSPSTLLDAEVVHDDCDFVVEETTSPSMTTASAGVKEASPPMKIVWRNVILFAYLHLASVYGAYLMFASAMWQTNVFAIFLYLISGIGVTAGAHRLWAHRSYKARLPLRILLAFIYTIAFENDIYEWARDHRVHHKYSETDADPHNATRGFFFAHVGWLLCRKHPEVIRKGKAIDTSDLLADPVVRFHRKFYLPLVVLCCFVLPTTIPMYFWGETFSNAFFVATLFRFCFTLNQTWLVNSAAHMWGHRPYDVTINPRQNALVVLGAVGEGFHNYHHTFPYDYATSEYGIKYNLTTAFIDAMALLGLAYDRKTASKGMIKARKLRTGVDGPNQPELATENLSEAVQNGVLETSKMVFNSMSDVLTVVQNGVNDILKTASVTDQDSVLETSKMVLNGVSDVLSKVVQNGMSDILKSSISDQDDVNDILQTSKGSQNGVHKRVLAAQNGVQQSVFQNGVDKNGLLQNGQKED